MKFRKIIFLALLLVNIISCAPLVHKHQPHAYSGPKLPEEKLSIIYGNNGGGDDYVNLNILAVDNISTRLSGLGARKAFVLPGERVVHIGVLAGLYFSANLEVTETFHAGHIYQLRHVLEASSDDKRGIRLWFEDMGTDYVPPSTIFPQNK